jgi:methyl-accepting chemotaxis protein
VGESSTTIDSLQIEIKTSSTSAAQGIDDLATSLGRLKDSGKITTVIKNLNSLSASLNALPNVHQSANSLRTLANSIEKLKSVGTVASLSSSLKKLPESLNAVGKIDLSNAEDQLRGVAQAVSPLSGIKAGGLGTMVNALKNLDKVTESLDDEKIEKFAEKVELLNKKLSPLSKKMTSIKEGFNAVNTGARKAAEGVDKLDNEVNTTTLNMASLTTVLTTVWDVLQRVAQGFADVIHQASQWDGIKYQFGNTFGEQADEYYEKITKITDALDINKQMFMENAAMAGSMLIGFGVDKADAREMGLGYTELAYDIWAAFNNVYETLDGAEGAMAAVRSALAGEVEPIRRAGFTIVNATLEQTAANHGLEISLETATEAQKSYLRYLTLVDQAQKKGVIGTYAREMNTAEGMMRTFSQQVKSLAQAFGSLFLPILVKVMPYVQAFVELLEDGVRWLASLLGVEIQDISGGWTDYSAGVDQSTENTEKLNEEIEKSKQRLKELKNAAIGIDELNVISPPSGADDDSSGGSGSGSYDFGDISSIWDQALLDSVKNKVDEIKEKFKDWLPVIGGVAAALAGLKLTNLLDDLEVAGFKLGNLGKGITLAGITVAVGKLVWDFTGAYLEGGDETDLLKAIGTTAIGAALAHFLVGKPGAPLVILTSGIVTLTKLGIEIAEGTVEWNDTESIVTALVGGVETAIGAVFTWKTFGPMIKAAWPKIASAATPVLAAAAPYAGVIAAVAAGLILAFVDYDFTDVGRKIGEAVGNAVRVAVEFVIGGLKNIWNKLDIDDFWDVLAIMFVPGELWRRLELGKLFTTIGEWIIERLKNLWGNLDEFFGGFFDGLLDGLDSDWVRSFTEVFDIDYWTIVEAIVNPFSLGDNIIKGIKNGMDQSGIKDKLSSAWDTAKTWWNEKKEALKTYTPSIGNISTKLSTAWTAAKDWWNTKRSSLSYTPSIGKIWEKLKSAWESAKNWWSKNRSSLSYTPTIGSIKDKLSSAWTTAKNWWSKNRSSLSYTPSIGSIKDKIVSAWNTAKKWWSSNAKLSTKLNISVPTIKVKWETASAFGKEFRYPTGFSLKFAADGGIFDAGSLIWAGERGPEVVANASGGKTGVMNVQQMQEAVYDGVYAAVVAAMRGSGERGTQSVNVYLDGRQITAAVEQRQRERGASLMGNEVYAY